MKNLVKNHKEILIVFISLFVIVISNVITGYYIDPAVFGLMFTPIYFLSIYFILGFFALAYTFLPIYKLFDKEERNKITYINIIGCLIVWLLIFLPVTPSQIDGVRYKLITVSEVEFQNFRGQVEKANRKYSNDSEYSLIPSGDYEGFLNDLKNSKHKIFNLSTFPIDIFKRKKYTLIDWSSGLTGGYEVIIFDKDNFPESLREYDYIFLYDTVAFKKL